MRQLLDPKRLADLDAQGALGYAIRAQRGQTASADDVAALARRLGPQLGAPTALGAGRVVFRLGAKAKAALWLVCAIGLYALLQPQAKMNAPVRHVVPAPATPPIAPALAIAPAAPPAITTAVPSPVEPQPAVKRPRRERSHPEPRAESVSAEAELALLQRAQATLDRDPSAALALAEQHARLYPRGMFTQEREILAIEALLKLRQRPVALARARTFVARFPESAHSRRVRALLDRSQPINSPASDHTPVEVQE
jgi:hypothetical protein